MPALKPIPFTGADIRLQESVKLYRKQARMPQWVLAKLAGVEEYHIRAIEYLSEVPADVRAKVRDYLRDAPRPRRVYSVKSDRSQNVYLTKKLMLWAKLTNMDGGLESARALKDAYDKAKREDGLASIPLIQLEVENALTLATRGAYHRARHNGTGR